MITTKTKSMMEANDKQQRQKGTKQQINTIQALNGKYAHNLQTPIQVNLITWLKNLTPNKANESTIALDGFPFTAINNRFSFIHQNTLLIKYKASFLLKTRTEVKKQVHQYSLNMTGKKIRQIREAKLTKSEQPNACIQRPGKRERERPQKHPCFILDIEKRVNV